MILRTIITTDDHSPGWLVVKLECGHEAGPISERRCPARRKRCVACETIAEHRRLCPSDHEMLKRGLHTVPMDDRAKVMVQWIEQLRKVQELRCRGLDFEHAIVVAEEPMRYPFVKHWLEGGGLEDVGLG